MKKVIVLGNDHPNTTGVVQSIGKRDYYVIAILWGIDTGIVKRSNYVNEVRGYKNVETCIDHIVSDFSEKDIIAIIPCCDEAALHLDLNKERLNNHFKFQMVLNYTIKELQDKLVQTKIANRVGFDIPKSWTIRRVDDIPASCPFPCIVKPLESIKGCTSDIRVHDNMESLRAHLNDMLTRTNEILLQQYINKDYDYIILGLRLQDGTVLHPSLIYKEKLYPEKSGLGTVHKLSSLTDAKLSALVEKLAEEITFVGLFSVEFAHSIDDGKYYFVEFNLRNDGLNPMLRKSGVNLPLAHLQDLEGEIVDIGKVMPATYIAEQRHFLSLANHLITVHEWWRHLREANGFQLYQKDDKKPAIRMFFNLFAGKLHIKKTQYY